MPASTHESLDRKERHGSTGEDLRAALEERHDTRKRREWRRDEEESPERDGSTRGGSPGGSSLILRDRQRPRRSRSRSLRRDREYRPPRLAKFDGLVLTEAASWIAQVARVAEAQRWPYCTWVDRAIDHLSGRALQWAEELVATSAERWRRARMQVNDGRCSPSSDVCDAMGRVPTHTLTWEEFCEAFRKRFMGSGRQLLRQFRNRRMVRGETVRDFADALMAIKRRISQTTEHRISNSDFIDAFLDGIPSKMSEFVGSQIDEETPPSEVIRRCVNREEWLRRPRYGRTRSAVRALAAEDPRSDDDSQTARVLRSIHEAFSQFFRETVRDIRRDLAREQQVGRSRRHRREFCNYCGCPGHATRDCPEGRGYSSSETDEDDEEEVQAHVMMAVPHRRPS